MRVLKGVNNPFTELLIKVELLYTVCKLNRITQSRTLFLKMDTIENNEAPAGSDDVTSSPDTAFQVDAQPVESEATIDGGNSEETGAPEVLLAGKYKSPEELEKAYIESQKLHGTLGQKAKVADLILEKYNMTPDQFQAALEAEEQARLEQEYSTNPAGYALREVQELKNQLALKEEEGKLNSFLAENPEYAPFKDKLFNLYLNVEKDKELGEIAVDYFGQAIASGQQIAYKKIDAKKNTQATSVSSVPKRQITEEDLKNLSVAELEALLPHADISHRL